MHDPSKSLFKSINRIFINGGYMSFDARYNEYQDIINDTPKWLRIQRTINNRINHQVELSAEIIQPYLKNPDWGAF